MPRHFCFLSLFVFSPCLPSSVLQGICALLGYQTMLLVGRYQNFEPNLARQQKSLPTLVAGHEHFVNPIRLPQITQTTNAMEERKRTRHLIIIIVSAAACERHHRSIHLPAPPFCMYSSFIIILHKSSTVFHASRENRWTTMK